VEDRSTGAIFVVQLWDFALLKDFHVIMQILKFRRCHFHISRQNLRLNRLETEKKWKIQVNTLQWEKKKAGKVIEAYLTELSWRPRRNSSWSFRAFR
jgi:hypothetical protein